MSGILGLFHLDGAPVDPATLGDMASLLERRGPERTGLWHAGPIGLGHTLLATTPEAVDERLPLVHAASGCVITADVRLDNREELLSHLHLRRRPEEIGDAEIVLHAYLRFGEECPEKLLGDFAFAIWDPREHRLFCARDHMGMRQLIYHHTPGRVFAFATEPRAILVNAAIPYRINEARIADFLVQELEGVDKECTFFEEVFRLPPAQTMTVTRGRMEMRRYWTLEPGPELRLGSDQEYAEAFLEVFTEAVRCRLRAVGPVGSMLSGGLDSGSVCAVASRLLAVEGRGPLLTFSAVSPEGDAEPETRAIHAAQTMEGIYPYTLDFGELADLLPDLERLTSDVDEPFDGHMTLVRTVYLAAHRRGLKMLLDGGAGDVVLSTGSRLGRLLAAGHWRLAFTEARLQNSFFNGKYPPSQSLLPALRPLLIPLAVRRHLRPLRQRQHVVRLVRHSMISEDFARRIHLLERFRAYEAHRASPPHDGRAERARSIQHPDNAVGSERYDRVAAAVAIESRDPFSDLRVAQHCVRLPEEQTLCKGWPKAILRRATAGTLPDSVRWRRGKDHLGWAFTAAMMSGATHDMRSELEITQASVWSYVNLGKAKLALESSLQAGDARSSARAYTPEDAYTVMYLSHWLRRFAGRPQGIVTKRSSRGDPHE